jgi:type I restriction enzyme R subunit
VSTPNEKILEALIEKALLASGYVKSVPAHFNRELGIDTSDLYAFIGATQQKEWSALVARGYGGDADAAQTGFAKRLASELTLRGTVDVLRHGVTDLGVSIQLAYFKPAHGLTPDLLEKYEANRVGVMRQFNYDAASEKDIDICLLVNGIPTATAELKNPLTGQTVEHAKEQYRKDRDATNVSLAHRAVVHFAVDVDLVEMTTKLAGADTRFLPFNQGSGGAGQQGGRGNPVNPVGHKTAYLWEQVWARDTWMDILARFVHVEQPETKAWKDAIAKRRVIFPRFHQWDAVRKLEEASKANGPGQSYLVQHSAGSGKSNTIAWIAHRLSNLHNAADKKVFDKVVVITDRIILDQQLQDTIYQFEHAHGVVVRIDENSTQLAEALKGEQAKIIITTLQKFSFILEKIGEMSKRSYAVIVDEAHSSQTGKSAKDLRAALSQGTEPSVAELAEAEKEDLDEEAGIADGEDLLNQAIAGRGRQQNISFLAFTATPKAKTLEIFGRKVGTGPDTRWVPFHLYSMRQAIEEGFIHDVLSNYTTYDTYWKVEKQTPDDPEIDKAKAKAAIARFVSLHPHNLAQKAEIIVEHFRQHTAPKIGGKAKAMVVTASRLHAVRYKQSIDKYIKDKGYQDVAALVAYSGKVVDEGVEFTEAKMNGFPEKETREKFDTDDYQVLIVAEKFQTGFDQPLLHTMYVDKPLSGLHAVQTLSRLNRTHPEKTDTFILDFRNTTDDIQKAFKPWFEQTAAIPTDPNILWDTHRDMRAYPVLLDNEIGPLVTLVLKKGVTGAAAMQAHVEIYQILDKAVERFVALDEDSQGDFRDKLGRFLSLYVFISQIINFTDTAMERDYIYCRLLELRLPNQVGGRVDLGDDVVLTHLRHQKMFEGSATLDNGDGDVSAIFSGRGKEFDPDEEKLSEIIRVLNEQFGLNLNENDKLLFDQFEEAWLANPDVVAQAQNNDFDNFKLVFQNLFLSTVIDRMDANEEIFKRILDSEEFKNTLLLWYATEVYRKARKNPGSK